MDKRNRNHIYYSIIRHLPAVIAAFALMHMILYSTGADMRGVDIFYGTSVTACVFMLIISRALSMCRIHRLLIIYSLAVSVCIKINRWLTFGPYVDVVEGVLIVLGFAVLAVASIKKCIL